MNGVPVDRFWLVLAPADVDILPVSLGGKVEKCGVETFDLDTVIGDLHDDQAHLFADPFGFFLCGGACVLAEILLGSDSSHEFAVLACTFTRGGRQCHEFWQQRIGLSRSVETEVARTQLVAGHEGHSGLSGQCPQGA